MPFSLIARAAYGDSGEARFGAGFAFGIPIFQKNQGEVARAKASAEQSRVVAEASRAALEALLQGTGAELSELERAVETLEEVALPAAAAAVRASEEIQGAGKSDLLPVLMSRRDYAALRLRRLDILSRSWSALARVVRWKGVQP
jgi:outer membrane protein, heavy metal efflux system